MDEHKCLGCGLVIISLMIIVMLSLFLNTRLAMSPDISSSLGIRAYKIAGGSMLPTLLIGDHIFVDLNIYAKTDPQRGDTVVFIHPGDPSRDFIKRIVAIPGDILELKGKRLYINGRLVEEPYAQYTGGAHNKGPLEPGGDLGPYVVPKDGYFMMGDNRDFSIDSRSLGFIDKKLIRGKARFVYWSEELDRLGTELK